jgi:hypothetical protein
MIALIKLKKNWQFERNWSTKKERKTEEIAWRVLEKRYFNGFLRFFGENE